MLSDLLSAIFYHWFSDFFCQNGQDNSVKMFFDLPSAILYHWFSDIFCQNGQSENAALNLSTVFTMMNNFSYEN